jgi:hypothetical protein
MDLAAWGYDHEAIPIWSIALSVVVRRTNATSLNDRPTAPLHLFELAFVDQALTVAVEFKGGNDLRPTPFCVIAHGRTSGLLALKAASFAKAARPPLPKSRRASSLFDFCLMRLHGKHRRLPSERRDVSSYGCPAGQWVMLRFQPFASMSELSACS